MTDWDDEKAEARRALQEAFGDPAAQYTPGEGGTPITCTCRLIQENELVGDLDREGYGKMQIDQTIAVFTRADFDGTDLPAREGTVLMPNGRKYFLEFPLPDDKIETIAFAVAEQK